MSIASMANVAMSGIGQGKRLTTHQEIVAETGATDAGRISAAVQALTTYIPAATITLYVVVMGLVARRAIKGLSGPSSLGSSSS